MTSKSEMKRMNRDEIKTEVDALGIAGEHIEALEKDRDRYKAALEKIYAMANDCQDFDRAEVGAFIRQTLASTVSATTRCVCGEINARNCPVHQSDAPDATIALNNVGNVYSKLSTITDGISDK